MLATLASSIACRRSTARNPFPVLGQGGGQGRRQPFIEAKRRPLTARNGCANLGVRETLRTKQVLQYQQQTRLHDLKSSRRKPGCARNCAEPSSSNSDFDAVVRMKRVAGWWPASSISFRACS